MNNKILFITGGVIAIVITAASLGKSHTTTQIALIDHQVVVTKESTAAVTQNDPQDIVPGTYKNEITNTSTSTGLSIVSGIVENNLDTNGKIVNDHLELALKNFSPYDMANIEVYYTVKDLTTLHSEGYYKKLNGFVLKAGATQSINFDNKVGYGHFGINKSGVYFTSVNKLQFDVWVSTPKYKVAHIQIMKDAGGAEMKD